MKSLTRLLALTATIAMVGWMNSASATVLSFSITGGVGGYTVNTGDITALTATKTIPTTNTVSACAPPLTACTTAAIFGGTAATFGVFTFNTTVGPDVFSLTVGDLTFSFTLVSSAVIIPTTTTVDGSIKEQFQGTITGDTSAGATFLGQTATLSESCTQTGLGSQIACSETVQTPGLPFQTPEPMSLALVGIGLAGLGFASRRRKS